MVLGLLATGMKPVEIAEDYNLILEDIRVTLCYAAKVLDREEVIIYENYLGCHSRY